MNGRLRRIAVTAAVAVALGAGGAVFGHVTGGGPAAPAAGDPASDSTVDQLARSIDTAQQRLRRLPGDWQTWAALSVAYLEESRITADPTWYAKAQAAAQQSLDVHPDENLDALVAQGALANARHDFATAQRLASSVVAIDAYHAEAFAVLADAETQLGHRSAATAAVQRLLDLRPGLSGYARASYDLEQRGLTAAATDLMTRALSVAVDRHDIAFARTQLGDLALAAGDLDTAEAQYTAGQAADPSTVALLRGRARVAAARGHLDAALTGYASLTRRAPTPTNLVEYADLLRLAGRAADADTQLRLARAAQDLFVASGGTDGLTAAALAEAAGDPTAAVAAATAEWNRRQHADVADALAWALHLAGRDPEAQTYAALALATGARSAPYAYHAGMIALALGDRAAARGHLTAALTINPYFSPLDAPAARRALAELGTS
jgi:tetratricopeptide (TPR) repeat protein